MRRHPPDILITTPESLYLMLTSAARETLANVETVIIDEIHSVAATKRGTHLMLSLERLDALVGRDVQRIGLSATQRPLEEIANFLGGRGPRGHDRRRRRRQGARHRGDRAGATTCASWEARPRCEGEPRVSIWPAIYPRLLELVRAHRSTIVFVNSRRAAERVANRLNELRRGGHRPRPPRLASRASSGCRSRIC